MTRKTTYRYTEKVTPGADLTIVTADPYRTRHEILDVTPLGHGDHLWRFVTIEDGAR